MNIIRNSFVVAFLMSATSFMAQENKRVSIFDDHIRDIASQEHITFREAAQKVYDLGYRGIDLNVESNPDYLKILDEVGFEHACARVDINFSDGDHFDKIQETLDFLHQHNFDKLLLIPSVLPKDYSDELVQKVLERIAAFSKRAQTEGVKVVVEDFDNVQSICYNMERLDMVFAASPETGHAYDSGNYLFAGEDAITALNHFITNIQHVHLKDRASKTNMASVAGGTGVIPIKEVVSILLKSGYDGWFCVEHFGVKDMYKCAVKSLKTVNEAFEEFTTAP